MRPHRCPLAALLLVPLILSGCVITIPPTAPEDVGGPPLAAAPASPLAPQTFPPPDDLAGSLAIADREGVRLHWPSTGASLTVHALSPADSSRPPSDDTALAWSPDGGRLAFLYSQIGPPRGTEENYLLLADLAAGSTRPLVAEPGAYGAPRWSPDGERLALFEATEASTARLLAVDAAEGEVRVLAEDAYEPQPPVWADGEHLAYVQALEGGEAGRLVLMGLDGTVTSVLVDGARPEAFGAYALSPDGERLIYAFGPVVRVAAAAEGAEAGFLLANHPLDALFWPAPGDVVVGAYNAQGYLIDPLGAAPVRSLACLGRIPSAQAISPDGRRIALLFPTQDPASPARPLPVPAVCDVETGALTMLPGGRLPTDIAWYPEP
jgi:dipeptidyl aminopeptidase/acylaminoacyl peptidase